MDFATKMAVLCMIRGKNHNYLCDKLKIDNAVMAMLRKGEILPIGDLEKRIRRELDWHRESDDLLEEVQQATYQEEADQAGYGVPEPVPTMVEETQKPEPIPVVPLVSLNVIPQDKSRKTRGLPRKVHPSEPPDVDVENDSSSITSPVATKPSNIFVKRMSMSYLQRPGIVSDSETGDLGTPRGTVVA